MFEIETRSTEFALLNTVHNTQINMHSAHTILLEKWDDEKKNCRAGIASPAGNLKPKGTT